MKSVRKTFFLCLLATATSLATAAPPEPKTTPPGKTEWELWLPPSGKTVKAVFVCPRWGDGANMVKIIQTNLGEPLGIATLLTREDKLTFKEDHFVPSIAKTLSAAAVERNHPELAGAPLLLWSHSNAAAYVQRCLKEFPERIIAYCLFKSAFGHNNDLGTGPACETPGYGYKSPVANDTEPRTMSKAATQVLGQGIWDMNDRINSPGYNQDHERTAMLKNMADARKQGALVHVALVRGTHHMIDGQQELMLSFFRTAMAMRLPPNADAAKGPVKLIDGLEERGLLQDGATRSIHDYADYPSGGNRRDGWWLPAREYAILWNNYALNAKGTMVAPVK
jgi:hypothetical protein